VLLAGVAATVAALVGATSLAALTPAVAHASTLDDESTLFNLHNQHRIAAGLAPLQYDPAAVGVARTWAQHLAAVGVLGHNPNLVSDVNTQVTTQWTRLGENVGEGPSAQSLDDAFMNSAPHRANILGDFNRVGVGAARDSHNMLWVSIVFIKGPPLQVDPRMFLPFSTAWGLVAQQYLDFFGRTGDSTGLSFWSNQLNWGYQSPASVIASFMNSPEFGAAVAPVVRLYLAYFLRIPDYAGLTYWLGQIRAGVGLSEVSDIFAQSAEFRATYGALSNSDFVTRVYVNVLNRQPDKSGAAYWTSMLVNGTLTRGGVMVNFSESAEYRMKTATSVSVIMAYVGMLRRAPDPGGYTYWLGQLNSGAPLTTLVGGLLQSTEYSARF
jgi:uncharacterized protein YkwD